MISFAIIGAGWRSVFYHRVAHACPDRFKVAGVVTRNPAKASPLADRFGVNLYPSLDDLLASARPLFVVTAVPWTANPGLLKQLADRDVPALSETPPATAVGEMTDLCDLTRKGAKIQVAEQYSFQPHHAARLAFARSGKIGRVTQAQVSAAHGYHGVSLIRRFLDVGFQNATITACGFTSPIVKGPGRDGPPAEEATAKSTQTLAWLDFGDRLGGFDFTGDQYFSYIRGQRLLVRGERGEIVDNSAVYLQDHLTPLRVAFTRHSAGPEGNLEGNYLKGIQAGESWVYRNPLAPGELSDDEIAVGACLLKMADYADGGPPFYPLADACQDRYLDLVIQDAQKQRQPVTTETQPWAA